ncbi:fibrinogen-like protein 1 [Haliotis rubra]|uniref:fibrinogen-like protein 1 n=1 Tax=Haliotis rubra TaxID=36100 RepID=UPI001EE56F5C|nr:fibrinogen-like protein 1 [Haliotis rubra]
MMESFAQIRFQAGPYVPVILVLLVDFSCSSEFREDLFTSMPGCSEGVILPVTPVNSDVVESQGQCLASCLGDSSCMSVNLCDDPQSGQVCHKLPDTSNGSCSDLEAAAGCVFLEPVNVCQHGGTYNDAVSRCDCYDDFTGPYCERRYRDCSEAFNDGMRGGTSNYRIISIQPLNAPREYEVQCLLGFGGWTVVEERGSGCQNDYNKTWAEYKAGWTTPCNRWLGLEALHFISNQRTTTFDIYVRGTGSLSGQYYYTNFKIGDEASGYTLTYTGNYKHPSKATGNGFEYELASKHINGQRFATWDHPDPSGCAVSGGAGWWYGTDCPLTNLHKKFDTSASASNVAQWIDDLDLLEKVSFVKTEVKVLW